MGVDATSGPGELDLHLIGEGRHERLWTVLGALLLTSCGAPQPPISISRPVTVRKCSAATRTKA